jgi:hypothetical protein
MTPYVRKLSLTVHVVASVGWLGAVALFLALAIAGVVTANAELARAVYIAMRLAAWYVILPLGIASLVTGLIQSLGTRWGLFRHYWVLAKLLINVLATVILLLYMQSVGRLADAALEGDVGGHELQPLRVQAVVHATAALVVLLIATVLSVFKPRGLTKYGLRQESGARC